MNALSPAMKIFVGVDGGATKTLLRIENAAGTLLGQGHGGAANIRLSVEDSWHSIREALAEALSQAGLSLMSDRYQLYCGAGLAGTELAEARDHFPGHRASLCPSGAPLGWLYGLPRRPWRE